MDLPLKIAMAQAASPGEHALVVNSGVKRASSLLAALRRQGLVDAGGGRVVRSPLGWLVVVPAGSPSARAALEAAKRAWLASPETAGVDRRRRGPRGGGLLT